MVSEKQEQAARRLQEAQQLQALPHPETVSQEWRAVLSEANQGDDVTQVLVPGIGLKPTEHAPGM